MDLPHNAETERLRIGVLRVYRGLNTFFATPAIVLIAIRTPGPLSVVRVSVHALFVLLAWTILRPRARAHAAAACLYSVLISVFALAGNGPLLGTGCVFLSAVCLSVFLFGMRGAIVSTTTLLVAHAVIATLTLRAPGHAPRMSAVFTVEDWVRVGASFAITAIGIVALMLYVLGGLSRAIAAAEAKTREVADLNLELKRQVADRSKKLADALARLDSSTSGSGLDAGHVIDGRYHVVREIGTGGMGAVLEVRRVSDDRKFAVKTLRGGEDATILARFAREAQIAAQLDHPNLVSVVDVDVSPDGMLYIVMDLVEGRSLEKLRNRYGDCAFMVPVLRQVASGLAALHAAGVVHRDVKPGNVLIDDAGNAKITDFGISALRAGAKEDETAGKLTAVGEILGTPRYMAPELWEGAERANTASDVFAFGVLAYLTLTGNYPWKRVPMSGKLGPVAPIFDVEPELSALVISCLEFSPEKRPTAKELATALA